MSLTSEYSGIIINQNATPVTKVSTTNWSFQNFKLPTNYRLGSEPGQHQYPALSGFQILVEISFNSSKPEIEYFLEYHEFGVGWQRLTEGTTVGVHTKGEKVWMDIFFDNPVPITASLAEAEFRIAFIGNTYVKKVWTVPALAEQPSYHGIGETPTELLTTTFNYRILALTVDSGTDFLGNPYRSIAVQRELESTSTTQPKEGYWRSSPQPSKFAVVSNYFDVRFDPGDHYGLINFMPNPSFEYDVVGDLPFGWKEFTNESSGKIEVSNTWASSGKQSLRAKSDNLTNAIDNWMWGVETTVPIKNTGVHFELQLTVNVTKIPATGKVVVLFTYLNEAKESLGGALSEISKVEEKKVRIPVGFTEEDLKHARYVYVQVLAKHANGEYEWYLDEGAVVHEKFGLDYFDGDSGDTTWLGQPGASPSAEIIPGTPEEAVVVDGVMIDPQTPNVAFNVYYSSDGEADETTTTREWEQKLWTRVPRSYIATQRQTYVFPAPVRAKYVKIEYSHLQPQSYSPGDFQKPVVYKKYPKWVADFFFTQLNTTTPIANRVGVSYDALKFAYEYILDDLQEHPAHPMVAPTHESEEAVKKFFKQSDATDLVDTQTLEKINLILNTYTDPPSAQAHPSTLLGNQAQRVAALQTNYPVEQIPEQNSRNLLAVSTLNRENILIEESLPIMFFFLTCRHTYKEQLASLEYNRAYFVGINQIAFIRNNYGVEADSEVYIESGGDSGNLEINDFVIHDDGSWSTF